MTDILQDLLRLIALNHTEEWVPHHIALQELDGHGDQLIPGLIECLGDDNAEVRLLAVGLLDEAGQRAEPAVPELIHATADVDRLVRVTAAQCLTKFGPLAVEAVPYLLPWLQDDNEYIRAVAVVTILNLDPTKRDELMPIIQAARASNNPMVRGLAEEVQEEA
jgi:HEAT repeat protein